MRLRDFIDIDDKDVLTIEVLVPENLIKHALNLEDVARLAGNQAQAAAEKAVLKRGKELR